MGLLYRHRDVAFTRTRDTLGLTDGNLASHAKRLEQAGLLESRKALTRDGFQARYRITREGVQRFQTYLEALQGFLSDHEDPAPAVSAYDPADEAPNVQG